MFVNWIKDNQIDTNLNLNSFSKLFENNQKHDIVIYSLNYSIGHDNKIHQIWMNFDIDGSSINDVNAITNATSLKFDILYIIHAILYNNYTKITENGHIYCKCKSVIINTDLKFKYIDDYFKVAKSFEIVKNNLTNKYSITNENSVLYDSNNLAISENSKEILTWIIEHSSNKFGQYLDVDLKKIFIYTIDQILDCSIPFKINEYIQHLIKNLDIKITKFNDENLITFRSILKNIELIENNNKNIIELYKKFKYNQHFSSKILKLESTFNNLTKLFNINYQIKITISDNNIISIDNILNNDSLIDCIFILYIIQNYYLLKKFA